MRKLVDFDITPQGLKITLTPEGREEIQEAIEDQKNIGAVAFLIDLCEHPLCNGWTEVRPEEVGALTDSTIFAREFDRDDEGKLTSVGDVFWFPNYMVENPVQTMLDKGFVIFAKGEKDIEWRPAPDGFVAESDDYEMRVGHKMDSGSFAYFVWRKGDQNQSRGEEKTQDAAKASAISLMERFKREHANAG